MQEMLLRGPLRMPTSPQTAMGRVHLYGWICGGSDENRRTEDDEEPERTILSEL